MRRDTSENFSAKRQSNRQLNCQEGSIRVLSLRSLMSVERGGETRKEVLRFIMGLETLREARQPNIYV